jgi:undecaprenyl-diphosphatase
MLIELLPDLAKLAFYVAGTYLVLHAWARRRQPEGSARLNRIARRRFEVLLLVASTLTATLLTNGLKTLVSRDRPKLWEAQSYWGSSFPSGHTLATAAFATAAALCLARIWPRSGTAAMAAAMLWAVAVALSRLVLGVHWPTDVLAALCLGAFIALVFSVALDQDVAANR